MRESQIVLHLPHIPFESKSVNVAQPQDGTVGRDIAKTPSPNAPLSVPTRARVNVNSTSVTAVKWHHDSQSDNENLPLDIPNSSSKPTCLLD
jgi:hypothetical protein